MACALRLAGEPRVGFSEFSESHSDNDLGLSARDRCRPREGEMRDGGRGGESPGVAG